MTHYARLRAYRRLLVSDIDSTLLDGARAGPGCKRLASRLDAAQAALVLATGRNLRLTLDAVKELQAAGLPRPEALICSVGSEIYLGDGNRPDEAWAEHLDDGWDVAAVRAALASVAGLVPQGPEGQSRFKTSFLFEPQGSNVAARTAAARQALAEAGLAARLIASAGSFLDALPARASKGAAVAWLLARTALDPRGVIVAGDSGNDREMLQLSVDGYRLSAVVVGNHDAELADLANQQGVYMAGASFAAGVAEGLGAHGWP